MTVSRGRWSPRSRLGSRSSRTRRRPRASTAGTGWIRRAVGAFFAPGSPWRMPTPAAAPLDPRSGSIVSTLPEVRSADRPPRALDQTRSRTPRPIVTVRSSQPRVPGDARSPGRHRHRPAARAWLRLPIPPGARQAAGTDGDLVVWQPSTDSMWEFWRLRGGRRWLARAVGAGRIDGASVSSGVFRAAASQLGGRRPAVLRSPGGSSASTSCAEATSTTRWRSRSPAGARGCVRHSRPAHRRSGVGVRRRSPKGPALRLDPSLDRPRRSTCRRVGAHDR